MTFGKKSERRRLFDPEAFTELILLREENERLKKALGEWIRKYKKLEHRAAGRHRLMGLTG